MLQEFNSIFQVSITLADLIQNLVIAFICGLLISFFYKWTYRGPGYLNSFISSLIILSMITAIVIMTIGNNLARAFGLVGAMSIIRFRTAVKDTQDIIFIFFSLVMGMTAGVGLHGLAIIGTLFIGFVALILVKSEIAAKTKKEFLLQFSYDGKEEEAGNYERIFKTFCKRVKLINVKSLGHNGSLELSYHISFKDQSQGTAFIAKLNNAEGVSKVNLFFDEEYF